MTLVFEMLGVALVAGVAAALTELGIRRWCFGDKRDHMEVPHMAVLELTGFTAQAEVLGSTREVAYENGVLEVRGCSLGEAKQMIERLGTGVLQAVGFPEGLAEDAVGRRRAPKADVAPKADATPLPKQ